MVAIGKVFLIYYLIGMNILTFVAFGIDKLFAVFDLWRIPEKVLFGMVGFGGSPGAWAAMWIFRHKIRKSRFFWGVPILMLLQALIVAVIIMLL